MIQFPRKQNEQRASLTHWSRSASFNPHFFFFFKDSQMLNYAVESPNHGLLLAQIRTLRTWRTWVQRSDALVFTPPKTQLLAILRDPGSWPNESTTGTETSLALREHAPIPINILIWISPLWPNAYCRFPYLIPGFYKMTSQTTGMNSNIFSCLSNYKLGKIYRCKGQKSPFPPL